MSPHVPSPSLLRHLARLTSTPRKSRNIFPPVPHQRCFSGNSACSAKGSTRARSPRARNAAIGSSWASANYDGDWRNLTQPGSPFADVVTSRWVLRDFQDLGLDSRSGEASAPEYILGTFLGIMKKNWSLAEVGMWLLVGQDSRLSRWRDAIVNTPNPGHLSSPDITSQAIYILGYQFITSKQETQRQLGEYMIKVAIFMRNIDAVLATLLSWHRRQKGAEPGPEAFATLQSLAKKGDIRAMSLRAEMLMWPVGSKAPTTADRLEAYNLVVEAFEKSEPGPQVPSPPPPRVAAPVSCVPLIPTTPPWQVIQRMGGVDGQGLAPEQYPTWKKAVESGARDYDDPRACELVINPQLAILPVGSSDWMKFATKASIAGRPRALLTLAQYHLELHGWFPPTREAGSKRNRSGFHWMEVYVSAQDAPAEIKNNALLVALLLRENGDLKGGAQWLEMCAERYERLAEQYEVDCSGVMKLFEDCHHSWFQEGLWSEEYVRELKTTWGVGDWYFEAPILLEAVRIGANKT